VILVNATLTEYHNLSGWDACGAAGVNIGIYADLKHSIRSKYTDERGVPLTGHQDLTDHARLESAESYTRTEQPAEVKSGPERSREIGLQ